MIASINPAGSRYTDAVQLLSRWLFLIAQVISANVFGFLILIASYVLQLETLTTSIILPAVSVVAVVSAFHEYNIIRLSYPQRCKQVSRGWRNKYELPKLSIYYGLYLGSGILHYIRTPAYHVMLLLIIYYQSLLMTSVLMTTYAVGKSLLVFKVFHGNKDTFKFLDHFEYTEHKWRIATGDILFLTGSSLIVILMGGFT